MASRTLFHVSEVPNIEHFTPRPTDAGQRVVWAIDAAHLPNYFLPRECPRVCVRRGTHSDGELVSQLLGASTHRNAWRARLAVTTLYVYEFESSSFRCVDINAGYFHSTATLQPISITRTTNLESELSHCGVELIAVESLWPIHRAVENSALEFSCIRMRNAMPEA